MRAFGRVGHFKSGGTVGVTRDVFANKNPVDKSAGQIFFMT